MISSRVTVASVLIFDTPFVKSKALNLGLGFLVVLNFSFYFTEK